MNRPSPELNDEQWQQIEELLYSGRKIAAVKVVRQVTGVDLKAARDLVEAHLQTLRAQHPERFPPGSAGGCAGRAALLALAVGLATCAVVL